VADPLRAALRVARARLTDEGLRELAHAMLDAVLAELSDAPRAPAMLDAVLAELSDAPRAPARRAVTLPDDPPAAKVDDLTAERAKRTAARLLG